MPGKRYFFLHNDRQYIAIKLKYQANPMTAVFAKKVQARRINVRDVVLSPLAREGGQPARGEALKPELIAEARNERQDAKGHPELRGKGHFKVLDQWDDIREVVVDSNEAHMAQDKRDTIALDTSTMTWHVCRPDGTTALACGEYIFVTMPSGAIRVGASISGENAHYALAGQSLFVRYAGMVWFNDEGRLIRWNNQSGAYRPPSDLRAQAGFPDLFLSGFEPVG